MGMPKQKKSIRFKPDSGDIANFKLTAKNENKDSEFWVPSLIIDESAKGCAVLSLLDSVLDVGRLALIEVGKLPIAKAEIRWGILIEPNVLD